MGFLNIKTNNFKAILVMALFLATINPSEANNKIDEFDSIRTELSIIKDKQSPNYTKTKQKLEKFIRQNNIDYSTQARFDDINRLISQQKFNCAIYELNELIEENCEVSKCYELLGDIYLNNPRELKKTVANYKLALQFDFENESALFKISKIYLREKRTLIGMEYLKKLIIQTQNNDLLNEIERIIKEGIEPKNRYEANILYEALGLIYEKQQRVFDSFEAYNKALQLNPSDIYLKYHLGDVFLINGDTKSAQIVYDAILKENPNESQIRNSKAKSLALDGNLLSASKEYQTILFKNPNSAQAKYGMYKIFENKLSLEEILKKINFDKQNYKVNQKELRNFSIFLQKMEDYEGAQKFDNLANLMDIKEKEEQFKKQQAKIQEEKLAQEKIAKEKLNQERKAQEAKKQIQKPIKKENKKQAEKITQKQTPIKKLDNASQKEKLEKEKLAQEKKQQELKEKEAQKKIKLEQERKAKEEKLAQEKIKQAKLKKEKEEKEYQQRAIANERQKAIAKDAKKYEEFQKEIDKYAKIEPKTAQTYFAIANTYKMMGEPTSAILNYKEALKLDPANSDLYYNLGLTYLELNSSQTAKSHLTRAIELDKNNSKAQNLLAFVNQKIITQTINDAYSKFESKEYFKALEILDNGIKKYPQNAQMYYYRALVYDAMKRNGAQVIDLQKAIELDPSHYMAYYQLGMAYEKINDEKSALVAYERFLSIEPDEKDLVSEIQKKVIDLSAKYY